MFNVQQITSRLSMMSDAQLAQYARMHKDDPYILPMASAEAKRRQQDRLAATGQQAAQTGQKPTIADQNIASMQLPEDQGIGVLPAQNIEGMADGGIAGYAEGKKVFDPDKYIGNPNVEKFLAYINTYEGSPQANHLVGFRKFESLEDHPRKAVRFNKRGDKSTAAGSYQLLSRTWDEQRKKLGLTDFSPENQKRAAIGLLKDSGALSAIVKGDFGAAKQKAARIWASIPGSTIGEATGQKARFKPQAEAILKTPTLSPTRMVEREQKPDLSKRVFDVLPFSSATAGEVVPRGEPKVSPPSGAPAARGVTPLPTLPKEPAASAAPPAAAGTPTPDLRYKDVPGSPDALEYERQLRAGREPEPSWLKQRGRELLGAPGAGLSALTGAISPLTGTIYAGARTLAGKPTTAEEGFGAVTYAPTGEYEKESAYQLNRAFEDFKIPPFIPGVGTTSARSKSGKAVTAAELAEAEAARAAQAAETAKAPRLEGPKSQGAGRASDLQQRFAEAQERSAKALETADLLATSVVDGKLMTGKQKAAALRASMPKTEGFTPDPAAQNLGVEALLRRKRAEQAKDVMRAKEDAAKAARKAEEAAVIAEREKALDRGDATFAGARRQAEAQRNIFAPGVIGSGAGVRAPVPEPSVEGPPVSDAYPDETMRGVKPGAGPEAEITPDKLEAAKELGQQVLPKSEGFSNEDILTMGLNMMMAQPGQPGGALSQLASNVGRSGIATLQSRREREKLEQERSYKDLYGKYLKAQMDQFGREPEDIRSLRLLSQNPELMQALAKKQIYGDITNAQARLIGEFGKLRKERELMGQTLTWDEFIRDVPPEYLPGGGIGMGYPRGVSVTRRPE
jgi:muramidase (phage lysozyme)